MGEVPPPYMPPAPRPNNNGVKILLIVLGVIFVVCLGGLGLAGYFIYGAAKEGMPFVGCLAGIEQVRDATLKYAEDHGGKLPNSATWQDDVRPYLEKVIAAQKEDMGPFKSIDASGQWGCSSNSQGMTGFAFNSQLSGKKLDSIKDQSSTILIFEIERPEQNAAQPYKARPSETSPTVMNKHRGWLSIPVSGDINIDGRKNRGNVTFGKRGSITVTSNGDQ